jgi:peptide/nickel transport system substrate-binding protein
MKRRRLIPALLFTLLTAFTYAQPVVVMQSADAVTLDPTMNRETPTFNVLMNLFDALLFKEPDGSFSPGLATSWEAVDDTTWTFELREGVSFHNGEPFTAEAVVYTIERILDPETASPIQRGFSFIESAEVEGDYGVTITTTSAQPLAETYFSELMIVPPGYFEEVGADAFAREPVGTGPYRFVSWQPDVSLRLQANADYWRGAASVQELEFRPVPEAVTRFSSLSAGETDLITSVPPSLTSSVESAPNARLETVESARVIYIGMNTLQEGPLQDTRVRQALNHAVDVDAIAQGIFGGLATPTTTLLTEADFGYTDAVSPYTHDPERARELLAEAGYEDGFEVTLGTPNGRYTNDVQVAQAVAAQLGEVGVRANVEVREYGAYVGELFSGNAPDLFLIGWGNAPLDADFILYPLLRTDDLLSYYSNPQLDTLLDQGHTTLNRDEREAAYAEALEIIQEEAPMIFLYKQVDAYGVSERLSWTPRADEFLWLYSATLQQ